MDVTQRQVKAYLEFNRAAKIARGAMRTIRAQADKYFQDGHTLAVGVYVNADGHLRVAPQAPSAELGYKLPVTMRRGPSLSVKPVSFRKQVRLHY